MSNYFFCTNYNFNEIEVFYVYKGKGKKTLYIISCKHYSKQFTQNRFRKNGQDFYALPGTKCLEKYI